MAIFEKVPVVDVHSDNISIIWPSLLLAVRSANFLAIDFELSGLGNRRNLVTRSMDDRYKFISDVAKTRSILAIGLACFKANGISSDRLNLQFQVQTFNITTLCNEEYVVEPDALQFLVNHGFDFNKQYSKGMNYSRGADTESKKSKQNVRELVQEIIATKKAVVLHNGLVDLVFLYQNLYCPLPANYLSFVADISEMFAGGIYDTKYIAEYKSRMNATYLEYVFRKSQRENAVMSASGQKFIEISFCSYPKEVDFVEFRHCKLPATLQQPNGNLEKQAAIVFCKQYGSHGWCSRGIACPYSHNPDVILDNEHLNQRKRKRKRNRKRKHSGNEKDIDDKNTEDSVLNIDDKHCQEHEINEETNKLKCDEREENECLMHIGIGSKQEVELNVATEIKEGSMDNSNANRHVAEGKHRAGFDAFMTGFSLATFIGKYGTWKEETEVKNDQMSLGVRFQIEDLTNRLYLSGKSVPLLVEKSHFSKTSSHHREKIQKICPPTFKHVTQVVLESVGLG